MSENFHIKTFLYQHMMVKVAGKKMEELLRERDEKASSSRALFWMNRRIQKHSMLLGLLLLGNLLGV